MIGDCDVAGWGGGRFGQICHGTASEMVTTGGEVEFVQRMMRESVTTDRKVLWWTCMLGKLSSVAILAEELKRLSQQGAVGGWGMSELMTGGGRTKRWVVIWSISALRIPDVSVFSLSHQLESSSYLLHEAAVY